jgi:hypothetical protein
MKPSFFLQPPMKSRNREGRRRQHKKSRETLPGWEVSREAKNKAARAALNKGGAANKAVF